MFNIPQFIFNNVLFCKKGKESNGKWEEEEEEKEGHCFSSQHHRCIITKLPSNFAEGHM